MNRKMRRLQKYDKKVATYNFTREQIEQHINNAIPKIREEIQHETVAAVTAVMLVCLHDEYGFGRKRMQRLLARFQNTFDIINTDPDVNLQDFYKTCYDEFGIELHRGGKEK